MGFVIGFFLGSLFGFCMMAIFAMSGKESRREEEMERRSKEKEEKRE